MSVLAAGIIFGQLAVAAPPAGDAPVLALGDRTELRARSRIATGGVAYDAETTPFASILVRGRRTDGSVAYAATLAYLELTRDPTFIASQSGQLSLGYLAARQTRLYVAADGSIGEHFTEGLAAPAKLGPTPLPTATSFKAPIPVLNSFTYRAEIGFNHRLDARWDLAASVMYSGGEGLDAASRLVLPRYYGPSGSVSLGYSVTKTDRLATTVRVAYTVTPALAANYFNTALNETWTHSFGERTTGSAGVGLSWQLNHDRVGERSTFFPDALVGLTHNVPLGEGEALSFQATGRVGFSYDAILRTSSPQANAGLGASWDRTQVGACIDANYLTTLPSDPPQPVARQVSASTMAWYAPAAWVRFETGIRGYRQLLPAGLPLVATRPNPFQWAAFLAVVLTAPSTELF